MKRALIGLAICCMASSTAKIVPVIAHNDGTAERLRVGDRVKFVGFVKVGFERPSSISNYFPEPPPRGTKYDPDADRDFICADLDIPVTKWQSLFKYEGKRVVATGIVSERHFDMRAPDRCPLVLKGVRFEGPPSR